MNDLSEITQLVSRERMFRVRGNSEIANCYFSDATVATSWQSGPASEFIKAESTEVDHRFPIVGSISTPVIHLHGSKAFVELPTETRMRMVIKNVVVEIESFRRLIYRVEKRHNEWKIANMISINESDNLHPVIPGTQFKIDPEELIGYRPSYQFLSYVRQAAGGSISQDLLGTDRPDDVSRIYQQAEKWVNE